MKAMVLERFRPAEENPLEMTEVQTPRLGPGEILVRVKSCGVCHTDLHTVEGELSDVKLPIIPGHEIVGTVETIGEACSLYRLGERVGIAWLYSSCGKCAFCLQGQENLCREARFTGHDVNGGYAEFIKIKEKFAYRIPEQFQDDEAAPLLCAGIIGYRALRLSGIRPGGRLGLYGFGASAHVAIQVALYWGCEVYVFSRSEKHLLFAQELGAAWTGKIRDNPPHKIDTAIIFAPAGELVLDALRILERGGTVAMAGIYMTPIPKIDYQNYIYHEKGLRSVANATRKDGRELLSLAAEIPIKTTTQTFALDKANEALRLLKAGKINGAAVLRI